MYEIFEILCEVYDVKPYQVSKATGVSTATLSSWKKKRYVPKTDKLQAIADYFGVSLDLLLGKTDTIVCPTCHQSYSPLNKAQREDHDKYHERFVLAEKVYGEIPSYPQLDRQRTDLITRFNSPGVKGREKVEIFDEFLKVDFLREIYKSGFTLNLDRTAHDESIINALEPDRNVNDWVIEEIKRRHGISVNVSNPSYYYNDEAREMAEFLDNNSEYRVLFDAVRKVKKEDIQLVQQLIERMSDPN